MIEARFNDESRFLSCLVRQWLGYDLCKPLPHHTELCWSPDGSEIAYTSGGRIMVVPIEGGEPREVRTGVLTEKVVNFHLEWSPDGKKLAFSAQLGGEPEFWFIEDFLPVTTRERQ